MSALDIKLQNIYSGVSPARFVSGTGALALRSAAQSRTVGHLISLFILGWLTVDWSLFDIGKYSVPLLYLAALPFCLRTSGRSICFVVLPIASTLLAVLVGVLQGVDRTHIASQVALQLLAIFFAAGVASIDWHRQFDTLTKMMITVGVPVVVYGGYQMVARPAHLPLAYLPVTNQQQYATGGFQRGWEKFSFTRASSIFVEPSFFGYFCLWLLILGLCRTKGRWRYAALALSITGMLFSQSLSAALGAGLLLFVYFLTHRINLDVVRQVLVFSILLAVALAVVPQLMPEAFAHFSERIQQALQLDERADSGRVDHLPANLAILREAPLWGHGLASLAVDGANLDVTTITYALLPMERGIVGALLFFAPWLYIGWRSLRLPRSDPARSPAVLLTCFQLYVFAISSEIYFLPFWFCLGITASLVLQTHGKRRFAALQV